MILDPAEGGCRYGGDEAVFLCVILQLVDRRDARKRVEGDRAGFSAACDAARGRSAFLAEITADFATSSPWRETHGTACHSRPAGGQDNKKERLDRRTTTRKETR